MLCVKCEPEVRIFGNVRESLEDEVCCPCQAYSVVGVSSLKRKNEVVFNYCVAEAPHWIPIDKVVLECLNGRIRHHLVIPDTLVSLLKPFFLELEVFDKLFELPVNFLNFVCELLVKKGHLGGIIDLICSGARYSNGFRRSLRALR